MQIYINHQLAAIKKGSSFEYVSENRLFSGSDAYTLSITFPLKDCHQNLAIFGHINRADVALGKVIYDCEIRDRALIKTGSAVITEVSDIEVKCQFLEGRSEVNFDSTFDNVYINELPLGRPDYTLPSQIEPAQALSPSAMDFKCVALPWVNNNSDSGLPHNFVDVHQGTASGMNHFSWADTTEDLTWQPFLIYIIRQIGAAIGYDIDLTSLEKEVSSRYLIICNTLPGGWDIPEFARALPHWTVEEFFSNLELFLGGEFDIDHRNKSISFRWRKEILMEAPMVMVHNVVNEQTAEIDREGENCEYLDSKNIKYKGDDSVAWKYYSCDWFVKERMKSVVAYDTLQELVAANKWLSTWRSSSNMRNTNLHKLLYAKDVDRYFIIRTVYDEKVELDGHFQLIHNCTCVLQPVNIFGERIVNESASAPSEELQIMPVAIDYADEKYGRCIYMDIGGYDENQNQVIDIPSEGMTGTQASLLAGSKDGSSEYFDSLYIGWWPGLRGDESKMPCPIIDSVEISEDWNKVYNHNCFNMRLSGVGSYHAVVNHIDHKVKKTFKFLANKIPDVRAIFNIRGKRYVCEKITATFTEKGMSQLLKGDFYPIID